MEGSKSIEIFSYFKSLSFSVNSSRCSSAWSTGNLFYFSSGIQNLVSHLIRSSSLRPLAEHLWSLTCPSTILPRLASLLILKCCFFQVPDHYEHIISCIEVFPGYPQYIIF